MRFGTSIDLGAIRKFARFDRGRTALIVEVDGLKVLGIAGSLDALRGREPRAAQVISDVLTSEPNRSWRPMIENWDQVRDAFSALGSQAQHVPLRSYSDVALEGAAGGQ